MPQMPRFLIAVEAAYDFNGPREHINTGILVYGIESIIYRILYNMWYIVFGIEFLVYGIQT